MAFRASRDRGDHGSRAGAMTTAGLIFNTHQGAATNKASAPALRCDAELGTPRCPHRLTASQNAKTGNAIAAKEAFDKNPRPIASPNPIQLLACSDVSLQQ